MAAAKPTSIKPITPRVPTHIALLRGINVGGKNMLPMAELARMFEDSGCSGVQSYIQSGNIVFSAPAAVARRLGIAVSGLIAARFGFQPNIMLRTVDELAGIAAVHPFLTPDIDHKALHVGFLEAPPSPSRIAALDPARSPGDRFVVRGREIYLHLASGAGKTRLTGPYFESTLATSSTFRNWRTVLKLAEMTRDS